MNTVTRARWRIGSVVTLCVLALGVSLYFAIPELLKFDTSHPILPEYFYSADNSTQVIISDNGTIYANGREVMLLKRGINELRWLGFSKTVSNLPHLGYYALYSLIGGTFVFQVWKHSKINRQTLLDAQIPYFLKSPNIPSLHIQSAPNGIIAVRFWGVSKKGILKSIANNTEWDSCIYDADEKPEVRFSSHGVHAFRLGGSMNRDGKVAGIVCLTGKCVGHKDHWIRAQRATILLLVAPNQGLANRLLEKYHVPVIVCKNKQRAIEKWAMSDNGLFWQMHNNRLLRQLKQESFQKSVESIPAYQDF